MYLFCRIARRQEQHTRPAQVYWVRRRSSAWRRFVLVAALGGGMGVVVATADDLQRYTGTCRSMGVAWTVSLYAPSATAAEEAVAAAHAEVRRLEQVLSDYLPDSELSQLSATAPTQSPVSVGDDLWQVLTRSVFLRNASGGAFDPTVGPLTTLWRRARRSGRLPLPERLAGARRAVGPDTLVLNPGNQAVALTRPGMRLDLGGIGMGYAIDRALNVLRDRGITAAMIDASGDIGVTGPPPGTAGWRVEVDPLGRRGSRQATADKSDPLVLTLADAAVTTSGDAFQAVEIDGVRYSHIVDPRTGLGVVGGSGVTVVAADATTADALATTLSVLGPTAGLPLVEQTPAAAARFVTLQAGKPVATESSRWSTRITPAAQIQAQTN